MAVEGFSTCALEKQIDEMVYALYGLTPAKDSFREEIEIVNDSYRVEGKG